MPRILHTSGQSKSLVDKTKSKIVLNIEAFGATTSKESYQ